MHLRVKISWLSLGEERAKYSRVALLALAIALVTDGAAIAIAEPCLTARGCRATLRLASTATFDYYRSLPLIRSDVVRRAVIVVHGNSRDGDRYFERLVSAARAEGRLEDVALFAPQFRTRKDGPTPGELYWSAQGWKVGNRSLDARRVSAFTVVDELLAQVCPASRETFPKLDTVVLIGHSAGAQFVNRYAAGGRGCPDGTVQVRYVVMNPSSYLYVDGRRPSATAGFAVPRAVTCAGYDAYKYGLHELNEYMQRVGPERLRANLFARHAYYLAGETDTERGANLDKSCAGDLQGANRFARHANYRAYHALFPDWKGSVFEVVPGVAHDGARMLSSEAARRAAFR